eukprot:2083332-Pleurochrysis_carterae.AAC.1
MHTAQLLHVQPSLSADTQNPERGRVACSQNKMSSVPSPRGDGYSISAKQGPELRLLVLEQPRRGPACRHIEQSLRQRSNVHPERAPHLRAHPSTMSVQRRG